MVECKTYRYRAHGEGLVDCLNTGDCQRTPEQKGLHRDPVVLFRDKLLKQKVLSEADVKRIDEQVAAEIEAARQFGMASPFPTIDIMRGDALYTGMPANYDPGLYEREAMHGDTFDHPLSEPDKD
jgi:pyruvate dehydrogenase E1 component alpha subunit